MMEESKLSVREQGKKIYDIYFRDSFDDLTEALSEAGLLNRKVCIVTESNVAPLYLKELYDLLNRNIILNRLRSRNIQYPHRSSITESYRA